MQLSKGFLGGPADGQGRVGAPALKAGAAAGAVKGGHPVLPGDPEIHVQFQLDMVLLDHEPHQAPGLRHGGGKGAAARIAHDGFGNIAVKILVYVFLHIALTPVSPERD